MTDRITCKECGAGIHSVKLHLGKSPACGTLEEYREKHPDAPLYSEAAMKHLEKHKAEKVAVADVAIESADSEVTTKEFHTLFDLGRSKEALNARGEPIMVHIANPGENADLVPEVDENHVWGDIGLLKTIMMGLEMNLPTYIYGHAGTGKTTSILQCAARTKRPSIRVQHTVNMEEPHVLGQYIVKDGHTVWQDGPLPMAMRLGLLYLADEYDFAMPEVLSLYQPVLEGNPLVIKEAPPEHRVIRPHPNFRFFATGNTNGSGDESGLYQGTNIQNSANYERFKQVDKADYMSKRHETLMVMKQGGVQREDAEKIVDFGRDVRKAYESRNISNTLGPRVLINIAMLGLRRGSYRVGVKLAFANRLTEVDREVVEGVAQRIFG